MGEQDEEEVLDVLDLPQLYTKPQASSILSTLDLLRIEPTTWQARPQEASTRISQLPKSKVRGAGIPSYLTRIVSSRLDWIADDGIKEQIWESASQRLAERSGRTGMGALSRTFHIPMKQGNSREEVGAVNAEGALELTLHEPALTADNLGLKTWASSNLLARRLHLLRDTCLSEIPPPDGPQPQVLELGAGTGLVGLAAAAVLARNVILTDLPEIEPNLAANATSNADAIVRCLGAHRALLGIVGTAVLDWSSPSTFALPGRSSPCKPHFFPLILAADPIYSPEHPGLLVNAIDCHLSRAGEARLVIELPTREAYGPERQDLKDRLFALGLDILEQGEEVGFDDWATSDGEPAEVVCWWSVWAWSNPKG